MRHQILWSSLSVITTIISTEACAQCSYSPIDPTTIMIEESVAKEETKRKLQTSENYQNLREASVFMVDINSDNYISDREFSDFIDGFNISPKLPQSAQQARRQKLEAIFNAADTTRQKKLSTAQFQAIWPEIENLIIDEVFSETDRNQNNYLDYEDLPTPEESQAQLAHTQTQMQQLQEQLKKIGSDEWLNNFIKQNQQQKAEEDYYQMDKDHNNCVDKEEYAAYQMELDNTLPPEERINFTLEDYRNIYDTIKRANPACVTQEEYLKDIEENSNIEITKEDDEASSEALDAVETLEIENAEVTEEAVSDKNVMMK